MDLLSQVTLKHLRCFIEVFHAQGVAEAARTLSITQSAASRRIADLEAALGQQLFLRKGRRLIPNTSAQLLLRHAETALQKLSTGLDMVSGAGRLAPPELAIGALPTVAATLVPKAILQLRAAVPEVLIRVETGSGNQLLPRLKSGQLDCLIGRMASVDQLSGLQFDPLFADRLGFVARVGHPLARDWRGLGALVEYPMILPPAQTVIRPVVDTFLTSRGIGPPDDRIETTAASVAMAILRQTDAIWLISRGVAEAAVAEGRLVFLPIDTVDTIGSIGLTRRDEAEGARPEMTLLFDILRGQVDRMPIP